VWFAVAWVLVVSGASVIGPVLLFVADALSDAMFLSVADAEFLSVADADPDGFAVPLPLELGIDVRVADPDAVGETCGAAEELSSCRTTNASISGNHFGHGHAAVKVVRRRRNIE